VICGWWLVTERLGCRPLRWTIWLVPLIIGFSVKAQDEDFRVYTEHPRLILTPQRLRLLKRERERDSKRWREFDLLAKGSASLPEPGFALALYYSVSGNPAAAKAAIEWGLGKGDDLRQLALVYDWCRPAMTPRDSAALAAKIQQSIAKQPAGLAGERNKILAWIALAPDGLNDPHTEEAPLDRAIHQWFRAEFAPALASGRDAPRLPELYPLLEILHAVRDNLKIDLREAAPGYFADLPKLLVFGNYPAPYQAPENEFRIPMYSGDQQPDLVRASLSRAAGLAMVGYDTNGLDNQFLQGWLIQDRFSLMTPFGAPYEYLWANPYQPGLSYFQLPSVFHDENTGALFVRAGWEEDADWFGLYGGSAELFHDGRITVIAGTAGGSTTNIVHIGDASIVSGRAPLKFAMEGGPVMVVGLQPRRAYLVETDDEEMREIATDQAGTLVLEYPSSRAAGVRIHEESEGKVGKGGA
jgi:hypothetical protein